MSSYKWIRTPADLHRPMVSYSGDVVPGTTRGETRTVQVSHLPGQYPDEDLFDFMTERTIVGVHHCQPGARHGAHEHPDMEQIYYVISGQAEAMVGDESAVVGPGSSVFIPPNVLHDFANAGEDELVMMVISSGLGETE